MRVRTRMRVGARMRVGTRVRVVIVIIVVRVIFWTIWADALGRWLTLTLSAPFILELNVGSGTKSEYRGVSFLRLEMVIAGAAPPSLGFVEVHGGQVVTVITPLVLQFRVLWRAARRPRRGVIHVCFPSGWVEVFDHLSVILGSMSHFIVNRDFKKIRIAKTENRCSS